MNASRSPLARVLLRWASFIAVIGVGVVFISAMVNGIMQGNETAHDLDHSDRSIEAALVGLAGGSGNMPAGSLPGAGLEPGWDVICQVGEGRWVGKAVAEELGIDLNDIEFAARNIYVVKGYWALAFFNSATQGLRIAEIGNPPIVSVVGAPCLSRTDTMIEVRALNGDSEQLEMTFVGTPPSLP